MTDPLITHEFQTPAGWRSGHLQTIRSRVVRRNYDLARAGSQRTIHVEMNDGSGDRLAAQVHASSQQPKAEGGLVLLVHGLGGSVESDYVRATAFGLLAAGFNVARVDLRSAGASAATTALQYHAGRTDDLRDVLRRLAVEPEAIGAKGDPRLAIMGFSLGGNMTIKLMGEPHKSIPLFAGVAVSAPLDLIEGSAFLRAQAFGVYERLLLSALKRQSLSPSPDGTPRVTQAEELAIRKARRLADFDDSITAPRNGWRDANDYYAQNSSNKFLDAITVPTLIIYSTDDPMIPASPYRAIDWAELESRGFVQHAITAHGGHVGFHERGRSLPWFVGQARRFLASH